MVHVFEAESGLGGVWQSNRYPGARVDSHVPNYEYSMEPVWKDWNWSERFPGYQELRRYFEHVDNVLDLSQDISLETRVTSAAFDPQADRWDVQTDTGLTVHPRFFLLCTGFASKPFVPDLPGLADFAGEVHHSARWPEEGVSFAGKQVGVIGTGASGVQIVQEAAVDAESLTLFQRTPVTALPMQQKAYSAEDNAEAKKSYRAHFARRNNPPGSFADITRLTTNALDVTPEERTRVFEDAWQAGGFHFWAGTFADIGLSEDANRSAYDFWRDKTRARIDDPSVAAILAPTDPPYPFGTKRPSLEQNYYDVFNQPNVHLIDLTAEPIQEITPRGIRTNAGAVQLDVLVLATGFDANTGGLTQIEITGLDGRMLSETWSDGVHTNLGLSVTGFPNMIFLYGPQSPTAFCNGPTCAELQGEWVVTLLEHMRQNSFTRISSTPEADQKWVDHLDVVASQSLIGKTDSWYMAANVPGKKRQLLNYPSTDAYLDFIDQAAANGYDGFALS
ncbi:UNVERIFIED_CONTAM: hypothetical protein GTU68_054301 [Idotea baltica]|nr:hypothetical protein [Idotea baltica]